MLLLQQTAIAAGILASKPRFMKVAVQRAEAIIAEVAAVQNVADHYLHGRSVQPVFMITIGSHPVRARIDGFLNASPTGVRASCGSCVEAKIATPFGLARVTLKPDGFFAPRDVTRPPLQLIYPPAKRVLAAAPVTILTPGTSYFDAYTEVTEPGLYYVTFVAKLEDTVRREIEQSLGFAPPKHIDSGIAVSQVFNVPPR